MKYKAKFEVTTWYVDYIEADSLEEAREKADDLYNTLSLNDFEDSEDYTCTLTPIPEPSKSKKTRKNK